MTASHGGHPGRTRSRRDGETDDRILQSESITLAARYSDGLLAYGRGLKEEERKSGDVDVYGSNGRVGSHNMALVNGPGILVGRKGTVGAVHYARRAFWPIDTVYYARPLIGDNQLFLYHLLDFLPLKVLNAATGVPGLSRRDAYALRGVFPPSDEQAAIARILDAVDTALERTRTAIERGRDLRQSLIHNLLTRGIQNGRQRRSEAGFIPKMWSSEPLGELLADGPTNGVYKPESDYAAHGTRIIRIDDFEDGRMKNTDALRRVVVEPLVKARYAVRPDDVLVNRVNSVSHIGKATLVPPLHEPTIFESNIMRMRCGPRLLPGFLNIVLCSDIARRHWLARAKPAVNQASINQRDTRELPVPIPPRHGEQGEIVAIVAASDKRIDALSEVMAAQQQLKKSLMHDLLTGRFRVRDVATVDVS